MSDPQTLYARWLSGELSEKELEDLRASGEIDVLQDIIAATDKLSLPSYDRDRLYQKITQKRKSQRSVRMIRMGWAVAASIAVIVIGWWTFSDDMTTVQALAGENREVVLPDASTVVLNDGSSLRFDASNYTDDREVILTGEAFFQVEEGADFIVKTNSGNVRVMGTSFNVRTWEENIRVECFTGKVEVALPQGESIILNAGERTQISDEAILSKVTFENLSPEWMNGTSSFKNVNAGRVFEEMERQFGVSIHVPSLDQRFSGSFSHSNVEEALQQVCLPLNLTFQKADDHYVIE